MKIEITLDDEFDRYKWDANEFLRTTIEDELKRMVRAAIREELQRKNKEIVRAVAHRIALLDYKEVVGEEVG